MFLNFLSLWPTPESLINADVQLLQSVIRPLGFSNKRAEILVKLATHYVSGWKMVIELPGVGSYGAAAHAIFFENATCDANDHALKQYRNWVVTK